MGIVKIDYVKGNNIIALEHRMTGAVYPAVNEIEAYWTALAAERPDVAVPARSRVDPRGIEGALSQAFILERVAPRVARFRLAGSHLTEIMGMEVRGMPLTAIFVPEAREMAANALEQAFDSPAKVTLSLTGERGIGRAPLDARMVLLPLRDEADKVTRVLGAVEAKGLIGRQPRRFAVTESRFAPIPILQDIRVPAPAEAGATPQIPGMAEPAASFVIHQRPGRPTLRVIENDRE